MRDGPTTARLKPGKSPEAVVLVAVGVGGVVGAEARYSLTRLIPHPGAQFPWSTLMINVSGCWLIGMLMVVLLQVRAPHRLARPLLGVGVLGGYTTYSTFAVDVQRLILAHRLGVAASYLVSTVIGCALAVAAATAITQVALRAQKSHLRGDRP